MGLGKMSIRILYLTREAHPSFRPDIANLFGSSLPKHGIFADILASGSTSRTAPWAEAGTAFTISNKGRLARIFGRFQLGLKLFTLPRQFNYDAIQVRDRVLGALVGLLAARFYRVPFFYWMSLPFPEAWLDLSGGQAANSSGHIQRLSWFLRGKVASFLLYKIVFPRCDHLFVQSNAMREMLVGHGIRAELMTPVPMGVAIPSDLDAIVPIDDERLAGRKIIIYLGALERLRHPEIMVHAMSEVIHEYPEALLLLVGDSQNSGEREWLQNEINVRSLENHVLITGWVSPTEAWRYLRTARIGLSPFPRSRVLEVASPTKVCEYLAYGVPVIANDQPDQKDLIDATGGGLCVPLTASGFAGGILNLLRDPQRAAAMAINGRIKIASLRSYDVLAGQLANRYKSLLG